jgi:hypothetical protein
MGEVKAERIIDVEEKQLNIALSNSMVSSKLRNFKELL